MTLTRTLRGQREERLISSFPWTTEDPSKIPSPSQATGTWAGVPVDEDRALLHIPVYACTSLISDTIGMLPWDRFRKVESGGRMVAQRLPKPLVLSNPSPADGNEAEIKAAVMNSLLLSGDTFNVVGAVGSNGIPNVCSPVAPKQVRRMYRADDGARVYELADGRRLVHWADLTPEQRRQGDSMLHWRGYTRGGDMKGLSPVEAGRQGISLSMAAEKFGAEWFGDGAIPPAVLKNISDDDLNREEAHALQLDWVRARRNRYPAVTNRSLEFEQIEVSPEESQFIESRKLSALDIAQLYRVPPHMVGLVDRSTSWGSGIEEQGIGFVTYTLGPWVNRYETAMSSLLPAGQYVKINTNALLRGRTKERFESYAKGRQWGWLSVNDIREMEDQEPIEGGDVYLQPTNMVDADQAATADEVGQMIDDAQLGA